MYKNHLLLLVMELIFSTKLLLRGTKMMLQIHIHIKKESHTDLERHEWANDEWFFIFGETAPLRLILLLFFKCDLSIQKTIFFVSQFTKMLDYGAPLWQDRNVHAKGGGGCEGWSQGEGVGLTVITGTALGIFLELSWVLGMNESCSSFPVSLSLLSSSGDEDSRRSGLERED